MQVTILWFDNDYISRAHLQLMHHVTVRSQYIHNHMQILEAKVIMPIPTVLTVNSNVCQKTQPHQPPEQRL